VFVDSDELAAGADALAAHAALPGFQEFRQLVRILGAGIIEVPGRAVCRCDG
jgi:hypothetical protein